MEDTETLVAALLESARFDEDVEYYQRGQPYAADPDQVLLARWVEHFQKLAGGNVTQRDFSILSDCGSELRRRGIEEPLGKVPVELALIQAQIRDDPD